ncbi:hypothetical protein [Ferrimonas balearica]|uniref:hypothetical protein n=1 Tax=Ferrimonas balearica TaxID=44012 RepID=UPI001C996A8C|nr:hypothetical protein [Ferrimonas balearica]MBY5993629.1 hypothetical protein [Ferrimonas balearica]
MTEIRPEMKLVLLAYGLFATAFILLFAPYAFADSGREAAEIMGGRIGMWSAIASALVVLAGVASCLVSLFFGLKQLPRALDGQVVAALALALLPLVVIGLFIWENQRLMF